MYVSLFVLLFFSSIPAIADNGLGIGAYILAGLNGPSSSPVQALAPALPTLNPTACGDIVNDGDNVVNASLAYQCLTSVPFTPAVATRFLKYYNDTIQFQSTLAFLKDPPATYKQPAIDLVASINKIQEWVDTPGTFKNQYAFEVTLQSLMYSAHDGHLALTAGVLSAFNFGAPYALASVSSDGKELPKVYLWDDIVDSQADGNAWKPSAIQLIDGFNVVDYLTEFAKLNSIGGLEPHADWNQLMNSPALNILGFLSVFSGSASFYANDTITFTLENSTVIGPIPWLAIYNDPGDTGPLATGGDFYNFFVLGQFPASDQPNGAAASSAATSSTAALQTASASAASASSSSIPDDAPVNPTYWGNPAYPDNPDIVQPDLATSGGGFITGYFLNDSSVGVLSIPSFLEYGDAIGTFSTTVGEFLTRSKAAGLKKIVIDLQQNSGGAALLAHDTFKRFFPNLEPFAGSRMRAHPMADSLGNTITGYWDSLKTNAPDYSALVADEWVATDRLNAATGNNFTSWSQLFGPHEAHGDAFTTTQRLNLSSTLFDEASLGGFVPFGYADNVDATSVPLYSPKDILILTDGICASTCTLFVEMMQHRANVSTVVVGGRPTTGPMQASGGTRGARAYSTTILDNNIRLADLISASTVSSFPNRSDTGMFINYASINLRDQIRQGSETPLQFMYEPAVCRLFWTFATVNNYTNLWKQVAQAMWTDPTLCVEGSRGHASVANDTTKAFSTQSSPPHASSTAKSAKSVAKLPSAAVLPGQFPIPIQDSTGDPPLMQQRSVALPPIGPSCTQNTKDGTDTCGKNSGTVCVFLRPSCDGKVPVSGYYCVPQCPTIGNIICPRDQPVSACVAGPLRTIQGKTAKSPPFTYNVGFCRPPPIQKGATCATPPGDATSQENDGSNLAGSSTVWKRRGLAGLQAR